jgi:hypothetical protein
MSKSIRETADAYLASDHPKHSQEMKELVKAGSTCIMPLIDGILARTVQMAHSDLLNWRPNHVQEDSPAFDFAFTNMMHMVIDGLIQNGYDLIDSIGEAAWEVLCEALLNNDDNIRIVSALIQEKEPRPSRDVILAVSQAKKKQKPALDKEFDKTSEVRGGVELTLWWLYNFILYNSQTDSKFEANFREMIQKKGFTFEDALQGVKDDAYTLILHNLKISRKVRDLEGGNMKSEDLEKYLLSDLNGDPDIEADLARLGPRYVYQIVTVMVKSLRNLPEGIGPGTGMSVFQRIRASTALSKAWGIISRMGWSGKSALISLIDSENRAKGVTACIILCQDRAPGHDIEEAIYELETVKTFNETSNVDRGTQIIGNLAARVLALCGVESAIKWVKDLCHQKGADYDEWMVIIVENAICWVRES